MKNLVRAVGYFVVFSVTGILIAYFTFYVLSSTESFEVPDLVGRSLLEANNLLTDRDLYLKVTGEAYDADIPSGHILQQDVPAGKLIKAGRRIGVIISKGPRILYTPMLSGLTIDEAESIAQQNNIRIEKIIKVHSSTAESGMVIAQDPNPEEHGAGGISLIVSIGDYDRYVVCPSFTDMELKKALKVAQAAGIDIATSGSGTVVGSQSPAERTLIKRGSLVKLTLKEREESGWWF